MYEPSKLKGNPDNLTGLLLITAQEVGTGLNYFSIIAQEYQRMLSAVKGVPKELENIIANSAKRTEEFARDFNERNSSLKFRGLYGLGGAINIPISSHIFPREDIDEYDMGLAQNYKQFIDNCTFVGASYFTKYDSQQRAKKEESSAVSTIYDTSHKQILQSLLRLSARLNIAVSANDPHAQLEAESLLHDFAPSTMFTYSINQIIELASSTKSGNSDITVLHCRIVDAVVREEYMLAHHLQKQVKILETAN